MVFSVQSMAHLWSNILLKENACAVGASGFTNTEIDVLYQCIEKVDPKQLSKTSRNFVTTLKKE